MSTEINLEGDGITAPVPDPGDVDASKELTAEELAGLSPRVIARIEWLTTRALKLKESRDKLILTMVHNDDEVALANVYRLKAETKRHDAEELLVKANRLLAEAAEYIPDPRAMVGSATAAELTRQLRSRIVAFTYYDLEGYNR